MADGCRLSARLWRPADAEDDPVPVILEHLPYRKRDGTVQRDALTHPWLAGHGYACIRTDMRGNGDSAGLMDDEYTEREWRDAVEVIAWAARQPWCDGRVGMMGISWGGFNALQVAALCPPALKAVITLCSSVDRFADDIHYKGGCLLGENVGWAANMLSYSSRPPDPALVGDRWREVWLERLKHLPFLASTWLRHQRRDGYWRRGSVCEDYGAIEAAVLAIGGWHDGYRNTPAHLVANLSSPVKAIVGPWIHKYPHYAAPAPAIGFLQEALRWWDRWLKGRDTGVEGDPACRLWLMDSVAPARWLDERPGRWIAEREWPSPRIARRELHLGDGTLSDVARSDPADLAVDISSPQDCGSCAGEYFPFAFGPELPDEQSADDARSVCFDGAPLDAALDIVGAPTVRLVGRVDVPCGFVVARLCDLRPDGGSALITMGLLNLAHRDAAERPAAPVPGETLRVDVTLDQIAYRVPAGHRLRVALSTSCWPLVWPSPAVATFTVRSGTLALPVRAVTPGPGDGEKTRAGAETGAGAGREVDDEVAFEPPEAAPAWRAECLRETASTRRTRHDPVTGETETLIVNDFGEHRDLEHGLVAGSETRERWSIRPDDPLSARVEIRWRQRGGRGDWRWHTEVVVRCRCDAGAFHLDGELVAFEGDEEVFGRRWEDRVPREFV